MIKNKKGFTLIELIIVMAIIGILAVVAIVAISGKAIDARNARRLADLSAVQTGLALYCADTTLSSTTITCGPAANDNDEVILNTCADISTIKLSTVNDPKGSSTACADTGATAPCNYGVTIPNATNDTMDACSYDIYAVLETGGDVIEANNNIHMDESGMSRT